MYVTMTPKITPAILFATFAVLCVVPRDVRAWGEHKARVCHAAPGCQLAQSSIDVCYHTPYQGLSLQGGVGGVRLRLVLAIINWCFDLQTNVVTSANPVCVPVTRARSASSGGAARRTIARRTRQGGGVQLYALHPVSAPALGGHPA
jgi:hypothetical protein